MKRLTRILPVWLLLCGCSAAAFAQIDFTWKPTSGPGGSDVRALLHRGGKLYAGTSGKGVYVSGDHGGSWKSINDGLASLRITALAAGPHYLFAATEADGVFRLAAGGGSWEPVNSELDEPRVTALAVSGEALIAGTAESGIFLSSNEGREWVRGELVGARIYSLAAIGSRIYAGGAGEAFVSVDQGKTWSPLSRGGLPPRVKSLAAVGSYLFAGGGQDGVHRSGDQGQSWRPVNHGLFSYDVHALESIGAHLFAATDHGVFVSADNGGSWTAFNSGLLHLGVSSLAVDGQSLFAGTESGTVHLHANPFPSLTAVSAASYEGVTASDALVSLFGADLAPRSFSALSVPLPESLGGAAIKVVDSAGAEWPGRLLFVSPRQINFQMPAGLARGPATVVVKRPDGTAAFGDVEVRAVAPAIFAANSDGQGAPVALVLRVRADKTQSYEPVARYDAALGRFVTVPIDVGQPGEQLFLVLYGTGLRHHGSLNGVFAIFGNTGFDVDPVAYVGPGQGFAGLDQVNVFLAPKLKGRGEITFNLWMDGQASNTVRIQIK